MKRLGLRQNQITNVEIPDDIAPNLEDVDFYDNLISHIKGFDACSELVLLDLSFNKIKHIKRVNHLTKLKDLFFVQNKISTIEGLEGLTNLRQVELGANRIRVSGYECFPIARADTRVGNTESRNPRWPGAALAGQE